MFPFLRNLRDGLMVTSLDLRLMREARYAFAILRRILNIDLRWLSQPA
jgi:hypothetical protein